MAPKFTLVIFIARIRKLNTLLHPEKSDFFYRDDLNVLFRTVAGDCLGILYLFNDVKTFQHLAEYGVLTVKVWRATYGGVCLFLFVGQSCIALLGNDGVRLGDEIVL